MYLIKITILVHVAKDGDSSGKSMSLKAPQERELRDEEIEAMPAESVRL